MRNVLASRWFLIGGTILVLALILVAGTTGRSLLIVGPPWLGLLVCAHLLARSRRNAAARPPDRAPSENRRVEAILSDRVIFERTTAAILEDFVHCEPEDFENNVSQVLSRIGSYIGADRCYLYRFGEHDQSGKLLLKWHAPGAGDVIDPPPALPAVETASLESIFDHDPVILVNEIGEPGHLLASLLPWSQVDESPRSCGAVRILTDGQQFGFVGFDAHTTNDWDSSEKQLLQLVANLLSTMFSRLDAQRCQQEAMEALEVSSKAKTDFLANMSHEIRTPMNGVVGVADLLKEMNLTPAQLEYVEIIRESGSLLMNLINDVLDLSKIEAGQLTLDIVETDLRALVEDLVGAVAFNAQSRGLELVYRLDSNLPARVRLDPGRVRQVLTNLLNNATKFTQAGYIYLNIESAPDRGDGLEVRFEVSDTGIGISQEQADRIFERFTQADTSTTRRFGGTGLGLSICRDLVGLMGGKIWAGGTLGEGSTFSFTIPVEVVAPTELVASREFEHHVLLVTGHDLAGAVLAEQIRNLGHQCQVAGRVDVALKLVSRAGAGDLEAWTTVILDPTTLTTDVDPIFARIKDTPVRRRPRAVVLSPLAGPPSGGERGDGHSVVSLTKPIRTTRLSALLSGDAGFDRRIGEIRPIAADEMTDRPPSKLSTGPYVLLAEDNPFNQKVALGILELLGCQVAVAGDGRQALTMAEDVEFDMIFMDCQMPGMDGYEATRRIRQLPGAVAHVPIIAITANALGEVREACLDAGMNDFLTKPVNKQQIDQMLAKWQPASA